MQLHSEGRLVGAGSPKTSHPPGSLYLVIIPYSSPKFFIERQLDIKPQGVRALKAYLVVIFFMSHWPNRHVGKARVGLGEDYTSA